MLTRRPFPTLLAIAAIGLALTALLLLTALPPPLERAMLRCIQGGGFCAGLLRTLHTVGSPLLLALLPWSLLRGLACGWRQWRSTQTAPARLRRHGMHAPSSELRSLCAGLGLEGRVAVVGTNLPIALCHGIRRPRILLSTGALALLRRAELTAVLRHEREHLHQQHPRQLLVAGALAAALPFLPILRELSEALRRTQELVADRAVIEAGEHGALGRALLRLVEARGEPIALPLAAGMVGVLDARLDQLTGRVETPATLSHRAVVLTWLAFCMGLLLLRLGTLGMGANSGLLAVPSLPPLRLTEPLHCVVLLTILCVALHELLARVLHAQWVRRAR